MKLPASTLNRDGKECVMGDIMRLDEIEHFLEKKDAVVHLAANSSLEADWESVYTKNILGTYNVYEACRRHSVRKIIFASSNHVTGLYEKEWPISSIVRGDFREIDTSKIPMVSHLSIPQGRQLLRREQSFSGKDWGSITPINTACRLYVFGLEHFAPTIGPEQTRLGSLRLGCPIATSFNSWKNHLKPR